MQAGRIIHCRRRAEAIVILPEGIGRHGLFTASITCYQHRCDHQFEDLPSSFAPRLWLDMHKWSRCIHSHNTTWGMRWIDIFGAAAVANNDLCMVRPTRMITLGKVEGRTHNWEDDRLKVRFREQKQGRQVDEHTRYLWCVIVDQQT